MYHAGLILEGGGMRGAYTAGVLDFFLDAGIEFEACYGVSAGACQCCSYISGQRGRAFDVIYKYAQDKRYMSLESLVKSGDIFNYEFTMHEIPERLIPFDYEACKSYPGKFYAVATNMLTGKAEPLELKDMRTDMDFVWASSSLPLVFKKMEIDGQLYMDGGIADSIPVELSKRMGHKYNVVVLTRDKEYVKEPNKLICFIKLMYHKFPKFVRAAERRHETYNKTLRKIRRSEARGYTFVIQPKEPVEVGRLERDREKLKVLYEAGYRDAAEKRKELLEFLKGIPER